MSERELELLSRIEELERHTWRNSAILRSVAMVAFTAMVGIVVAAFWLGAGAGGALLLALLACTAMMVALVWIAVRPTRMGAVDPVPTDRPYIRRDDRAGRG